MIRIPPRSTRTETPFSTLRSSDPQYAPEQGRPLLGRALAVGEHLHHCLLHRVHRVLAVAQAGLGEAERARADAGQEGVERGIRRRFGVADRRIGDGAGSGTHAVELSRSEEHTSELQSLMRISYAVFCLKKKKIT